MISGENMEKTERVTWSTFRISKAYVVAAFFSALSILAVLEDYYLFGLSYVVGQLVDAYGKALRLISYPIRAVFEWLFAYFRFDVTLDPVWSYVFVLLFIKIGLDFRIDFLARRYWYACLEVVLGFIFALFFSIAAGLLYDIGGILLPICCIAALVIYEFTRAFFAATLYAEFEPAYWTRLWYRQRHYTLPMAIAGAAALVLYLVLAIIGVKGADIVSMLCYILFVGFASLADAAAVAMSRPKGNRLSSFIQLQRRHFGLAILYGYALVMLELWL